MDEGPSTLETILDVSAKLMLGMIAVGTAAAAVTVIVAARAGRATRERLDRKLADLSAGAQETIAGRVGGPGSHAAQG